MDPYATHLPALCAALCATGGSRGGGIMEFGLGDYSTPVLTNARRPYIGYEEDPDWLRIVTAKYIQPRVDGPLFFPLPTNSKLLFAPTPDDFDHVNSNNALIFIDGSAASRLPILQWAATTRALVVCHDTNPEYDHLYHYSRAFPLFKHHLRYTAHYPSTDLLTNSPTITSFLRDILPLTEL